MRWLAFVAASGLGAMACSTTVIVQDGGGGQGPLPSTGGSPAIGGFGGDGGDSGDGGTGGEPPTVVPGCEQLAFVGEPVIAPALTHAREVRAAPLAAGRIGLAWVDHDNETFDDVLMSRTIDSAFDTWPPVLNPAVQSLTSDILPNGPGPIQSRADGVFAVGPGIRGILAFEHTGLVAPFGDGWQQAFPEPAPSTGLLGVAYDFDTHTSTLESLPDLSGDAPSYVATFAPGCVTMRAVFDGDSTFFSSGTGPYCDDSPHVDFHRFTSGELVWLGGFDLPFRPVKQELAARPGGGYWYSISNWKDGIAVYALDDDGVPVGAPWTDSYTLGDTSPMFHAWRDGFVVSKRTPEGVSVFVSDGYNITASDVQSVEVTSSNAEFAMVVGGANDGSIFFAYPVFEGVELFRADCFSGEQ